MYIFLLHDSMPCISTALKNRLRNSNFVALKFYKGCDRDRHHPNGSSVSDRFNGWDLEPIWQNFKHGYAENYKIHLANKVTWLFKLIGTVAFGPDPIEIFQSRITLRWNLSIPIGCFKWFDQIFNQSDQFRVRVNWGRKYFLPRAQV